MWGADCIEVCDEEAGDEGEVYVDVSGWGSCNGCWEGRWR